FPIPQPPIPRRILRQLVPFGEQRLDGVGVAGGDMLSVRRSLALVLFPKAVFVENADRRDVRNRRLISSIAALADVGPPAAFMLYLIPRPRRRPLRQRLSDFLVAVIAHGQPPFLRR